MRRNFGGQHLDGHGALRRKACPRSADPSPARTVERIEAMANRLGNGSLAPRASASLPRQSVVPYDGPAATARQFFAAHPSVATAVAAGDQERQVRALPATVHAAAAASAASSASHQVVFVCHGHCQGPECEFTQSIRHWSSMVTLNDGACFRSEVVERAPLSLMKLEERRRNLSQMREVLAGKLESKQERKKRKQVRQTKRDQQRLAVASQRTASSSPLVPAKQTEPARPASAVAAALRQDLDVKVNAPAEQGS